MGPRIPRGRDINLGIDIGGTKILAVRANGRSVEVSTTARTPSGGPEAVGERVVALVDKLDPRGEIPVIGVGIAGVVCDQQVLVAPNLHGWDRPVDFGATLRTATGRDVVIGNDVNLATLAEHRLGSHRVDNLLGVFIGTGVGAGLVLDGELRSGPNGLAGELGHMTVVDGGAAATCSCGSRGHLEAYVGRRCLEALAREAHAGGRATALVDLAPTKRMTSTVWGAAVDAGDELATELLAAAAHHVGRALATVAVVVDIDQVVIGGGFATRLGPGWLAQVEQSLEHHLAFAVQRPAVVTTSVGDSAAALGAAILAGS